jgi:hypothetical protein
MDLIVIAISKKAKGNLRNICQIVWRKQLNSKKYELFRTRLPGHSWLAEASQARVQALVG